MSDISKKYQEILDGLDKNVKDKNELNLLKSQISELIVFYTDLLNRAAYVEENLGKVDRNIRKLSKRIDNIEEDIYIDSDEDVETLEELGEDQMHDNDFEFEITCPYCNYEFITDSSFRNETSVRCPKCKKTIQLDWNSEEVCDGECDSCKSHCYEEKKDENSNMAVKEDETKYNVEIKKEEDKHNDNEDDM